MKANKEMKVSQENRFHQGNKKNMLILTKKINVTILSFFLIILIICTGCSNNESNPSDEKIKQMQDEVINIKLETERLMKVSVENKKDLEIIKQHLIPSYKARLDDEGNVIEETETTIEQVDSGNKETIKVNVIDSNQANVANTTRPNALKEDPKAPSKPATNVLPSEAMKPASKKLNTNTDNRNPPENIPIRSPANRDIPKILIPGRSMPNTNIPQPETSEPISPKSSIKTRNINYTFTDIMDHPDKQYIGVLATIGGILDRNTGKYEPEEVITKADYLTWLFKTYNAYHNNISPAKYSSNVVDVFDDVPPSHYAYPYIQGLANAGLLISFNKDNILHPDDPISREELIAFAEYVQRQSPDNKLKQITPQFCNLYIKTVISDGKDISLDYSQMVYRSINENSLIEKTFKIFDKKIPVLIPEKSVTRAQAAASLCFMDNMSPRMLGFVLKDYYEDNKKKFS